MDIYSIYFQFDTTVIILPSDDIIIVSAIYVFRSMPLDHCFFNHVFCWALQRLNERQTPGKASGEKHPVSNEGGLIPSFVPLFNTALK